MHRKPQALEGEGEEREAGKLGGLLFIVAIVQLYLSYTSRSAPQWNSLSVLAAHYTHPNTSTTSKICGREASLIMQALRAVLGSVKDPSQDVQSLLACLSSASLQLEVHLCSVGARSVVGLSVPLAVILFAVMLSARAGNA